jgi:broad specificity phosphatase PhoE
LQVRYPGREMVIVSHGAVIQAVGAHITGDWSDLSVPPNCGLVTLDYVGRGSDGPPLWGPQRRPCSRLPVGADH